MYYNIPIKNTFNINVTKFTYKTTVYHFKFRYDLFSGAGLQMGPMSPHFWGFIRTPHYAGLLWTGDQSAAEASPWQYTIYAKKTSKPHDGNRTRIPSKQAAADPRFRQRGYRDLPPITITYRNSQTLRHWTHSLVLSEATCYVENSTRCIIGRLWQPGGRK
jgi:hypothetical protein